MESVIDLELENRQRNRRCPEQISLQVPEPVM
jgi:hypothetical protein